MTKFLKNISVESEGHIQFKTVDGTNAGKIDQDGNDLVLTNAVGDVLLGDGDSDVYIGNGSDNVDILFEQSGNIKADDSASGVTLTLGSSNTTLNLESPNINGNLSIGLTSISNKLTFTGNDGYILFDREPSNYDGTTSIPLLKVDQSGTEKTILERVSANGGILLGADDTIIIAGGDTRNVLRTNLNETGENVVIASEGGFAAYGFPGNDTSWANRNVFRFKSDSSTASENGLYIGDGGSTQFIDLSRNLTVGTINSGAITSTGKIQGTELEGTSLDINGDADIAGVTLLQASTGGNTKTTLIPLDSGGNSKLKIKGGNYIHTVAFETSWNDFEYAKLIGGYNTGDSHFNINKSDASGAIDATTRISTGDSFFAGNVGIGTTSPSFKLDVNGEARVNGTLTIPGVILHDGDVGTSIGFTNNDTITLSTNNSPKLVVDALGQTTITGNLNVGTDAFNSLSINSGLTGTTYTTNANGLGSQPDIFFKTGVNTRLKINGVNGNVGIGTTSPSAKLHIIDNTEQSQVRIGSDTSNYLSVDVAGDGDSTISAIGNGFLPPDINFNTNSTTVLKVSGTLGYVGIGTVTPSEKLEVNGNVQAETLIATDLAEGYVPYNRNGTLGLQDSSIYQDSGNVGIGTTTLSQALNVNGNILATGYRVSAMQTAPSSRSDTGTLGEIRITADYIYVCYATDSWRRVAISAW